MKFKFGVSFRSCWVMARYEDNLRTVCDAWERGFERRKSPV